MRFAAALQRLGVTLPSESRRTYIGIEPASYPSAGVNRRREPLTPHVRRPLAEQKNKTKQTQRAPYRVRLWIANEASVDAKVAAGLNFNRYVNQLIAADAARTERASD
jgi:hypothetical protein